MGDRNVLGGELEPWWETDPLNRFLPGRMLHDRPRGPGQPHHLRGGDGPNSSSTKRRIGKRTCPPRCPKFRFPGLVPGDRWWRGPRPNWLQGAPGTAPAAAGWCWPRPHPGAAARDRPAGRSSSPYFGRRSPPTRRRPGRIKPGPHTTSCADGLAPGSDRGRLDSLSTRLQRQAAARPELGPSFDRAEQVSPRPARPADARAGSCRPWSAVGLLAAPR